MKKEGTDEKKTRDTGRERKRGKRDTTEDVVKEAMKVKKKKKASRDNDLMLCTDIPAHTMQTAAEHTTTIIHLP